MFRKLASIALASIALAAPASAEIFNLGGGLYMATADDGSAVNIEIDHVDHEGDRYMNLQLFEVGEGMVSSNAWVKCDSNQILHAGMNWQNVDHRTMNGYIWDVACR